MKAIMYHYIRPKCKNMPYFKHLDFDDFKRQLDVFQRKYGFVEKKEFLECIETKKVLKSGIILTFDDGLIDHYDYVFKELKERKLWGCFFVPVQPYISRKILNVHKIHLLLGTYGGSKIYNQLNELLKLDILRSKNKSFDKITYLRQTNDEYTKQVKKILNYYVDGSEQNEVLEKLFDLKIAVDKCYMSTEHIKEMYQYGMVIGSHGVNHSVMSKLTEKEQFSELKKSFDFFQDLLGDRWMKTYCHPYGNELSYNEITKNLLRNLGSCFSFAVNPRDFIDEDFYASNIHTLPRYDCNQFEFGKAFSFF